jgi:hypothetical protein
VRQMLQRRSTKWGYGRWERLTAKDKVLDELIAKLEATTPLRFNSAPKRWRGKARLVGNSRRLTARMRRSMVVCRLNQLASQQAAKQGDEGLLRAYQPRTEANLGRALNRSSAASVRSCSDQYPRGSRQQRSATAAQRCKVDAPNQTSSRTWLVTTAERTVKRCRGFSGATNTTVRGPISVFQRAKRPPSIGGWGGSRRGDPRHRPHHKQTTLRRRNVSTI